MSPKPLFTPVQVHTPPKPIRFQEAVLGMGSCFAERIGSRLAAYPMDVLINPFGTTYQPEAIARQLEMALQHPPAVDFTGFLEREGLHFHFDAYTGVYAHSQSELEEILLARMAITRDFLLKSQHLILTFGTAFQYILKSENRPVANCHKVPAKQFNKTLRQVHEMLERCLPVLEQIRSLNPELQIILTVSPVRHTREGLSENMLSKSMLRVLCHLLSEKLANTWYFPAYEMMLDELRDYRFYDRDLIHPNELAEDIIWERFATQAFDTPTLAHAQTLDEIHRDLQHDLKHPESSAARRFLEAIAEKIDAFPYPLPREMNKLTQKMKQLPSQP
jgi:hypothetical protein